MTQRERHTPGDGAASEATGAAQPALSDSSVWGEWYHRASSQQQRDAVAAAVQQGILYTHQLATPALASASCRPLLSALLNDPIETLGPLHPPGLEYHDRQLDRTQRDAVARAVATPDVYLIQGFPGTGKSRIVAEIILQATRRGQRVLFLASTPAALDRVLERLSTCPTVCPIRCLARDEARETLPPSIARLTLAERLRSHQDTTLPAARAARDAARQACEAGRREQPSWTRLHELAEQAEECARNLQALTEQRAGVSAEVDRDENAPSPARYEDADSFRARRDACAAKRLEDLDRLESQLAGLRAELETITGKQGHLEHEWEQVRPLIEARQGRRFWTGAWWRGVTRGGLPEQMRELDTRRAELRTARERLEQDIAACLAERATVEDRYVAECRRLKEEEIACREAELDSRIAVVAREQDALREQWRIACQTLPPGSAPAEMSRQATASARAEWERQRTRQERQAAAAEQWLQAVEDGLRTLPDKLAGCANVVAATTTALAGDPHFGERNGTPGILFDLLILEEAHQVTESEFAAAARRARRWVLVGEPALDAEPPVAPRKLVKAAVLRPGFFQRLWHHLHADPHRLPFTWVQREGRLLCRLRPISVEQRNWVESEPVVDRPDIELRIVSIPRQPPRVAEVVFPAYMSIGEAKQFILRELDELAVHTRGRSLCWNETDEDVVLELAPSGDPDTVTVMLDEGVCERVSCVTPPGEVGADGEVFWHTCQLRFARAVGWTRARAEQWIAERLGLRSAGRTILLTMPYRLDSALARFLSDLLFGGACHPPPATLDVHPPVEFVAVPSLASLEGRHRADTDAPWNGGESSSSYGQAALSVRAPRLRAVKGGAGLELDLADNRPLEQLPPDLRAVLPRQGLVNYLEARALLKRLETLRNDAVFQAACARWRQRRPWPCGQGCASANCDCPHPDSGPAVAVMALYPAQVELLQHLIRQAPALVECPFSVEVGLPSAFHHRECLLALVSLTRSHTHRAVSYGDHPHVLTQALTRAASGLILFGDPGTLVRRSQWRGPLDHLDESAAQREGGLATQLVHYLQGHGPHPSAFHIQEGSGV